jgi:hypothetical protein
MPKSMTVVERAAVGGVHFYHTPEAVLTFTPQMHFLMCRTYATPLAGTNGGGKGGGEQGDG